MRKIIISVIVCLMLIGSGFFMVNGLAKVNIKGAKGIDQKDTELNNKINQLLIVISNKYSTAESNLKQATTKLIDSKTEYENQAALSNSNSSSYASKLETYDIDYLWTKLGNYAKDENVVIKIDVTAGGASSNLYNLNFTVTGSYVGTTDFIYDIENDSKLGFKIDNFKMISGYDPNSDSSEFEYEVVGSFVCQDIPLSVGNIEATVENNTDEKSKEDTNNNNNTTSNTTTDKNANNSSSNNTTNNSIVSQYGITDPNHSNLTSIDDVIN